MIIKKMIIIIMHGPSHKEPNLVLSKTKKKLGPNTTKLEKYHSPAN